MLPYLKRAAKLGLTVSWFASAVLWSPKLCLQIGHVPCYKKRKSNIHQLILFNIKKNKDVEINFIGYLQVQAKVQCKVYDKNVDTVAV